MRYSDKTKLEAREACAAFERAGIAVGFAVKLHAPKGDVFNTWGGAESGYGIG